MKNYYYLAIYADGNDATFTAGSLREAKGYAQSYKRRMKIKGRTIVRRLRR